MWLIDPNSTFVETEAECTALFVNDIREATDVKIYPNPVHKIININLLGKNNIHEIKIYDIMGKIQINKTDVQKNATIDLSGFVSGIYIINIQTDKEIFTAKIIKR